MGATATKSTTIEEYLSEPAYEHSEYVNGAVVELNLGTKQHARIASRCAYKLEQYLEQHPGGSVYVELRCRLRIGGQTCYRLPDVCYVLSPFEERYLERAPDLCAEIRSPDDSISNSIAKFADYFANGCKLGWLILPEEQSVLVLTPGTPAPTVARISDALGGGSLLPGLQIPVASLFV
jgi:Uma2 family endonuclease